MAIIVVDVEVVVVVIGSVLLESMSWQSHGHDKDLPIFPKKINYGHTDGYCEQLF